MTIEEIFIQLAKHMKKGVETHRQFMNAYDFLGLKGYYQCHYYHYLTEFQNCHLLYHYYMIYQNKLLNIDYNEKVEIIPSSWYKYTQFEVDVNTRRNAIKEMMQKWIEWETSTKALLQELCKELDNLNELAIKEKFLKFLYDVSDELNEAKEEYLKLESIGYDIVSIIDRQNKIFKKYKIDN